MSTPEASTGRRGHWTGGGYRVSGGWGRSPPCFHARLAYPFPRRVSVAQRTSLLSRRHPTNHHTFHDRTSQQREPRLPVEIAIDLPPRTALSPHPTPGSKRRQCLDPPGNDRQSFAAWYRPWLSTAAVHCRSAALLSLSHCFASDPAPRTGRRPEQWAHDIPPCAAQ